MSSGEPRKSVRLLFNCLSVTIIVLNYFLSVKLEIRNF
uniref:Uncharacterized protein n=1 Tax=Myoviridae sp. ctJ2i1 TaxID=2825079 RepID=A0A8S5V1M1_9CAUD|nr:MAG TPA: hypothetical protein [Myoviridae sp. ctJ2i1]DAW79626.1 MAG TPA: hypothetical protein [Caudoviricetes sp.]